MFLDSTSETIQLVIVLPNSCLSWINICKHLRVEPKCDWFYEPCCLCDLLRPILDETQRPAHVWLKIAFYGVLGIDQLEWSLILELETSILNLNRFHNNPRMCYLSWAEPDIPKEDVFEENRRFVLGDNDGATFANPDGFESNRPLCSLWEEGRVTIFHCFFSSSWTYGGRGGGRAESWLTRDIDPHLKSTNCCPTKFLIFYEQKIFSTSPTNEDDHPNRDAAWPNKKVRGFKRSLSQQFQSYFSNNKKNNLFW